METRKNNDSENLEIPKDTTAGPDQYICKVWLKIIERFQSFAPETKKLPDFRHVSMETGET